MFNALLTKASTIKKRKTSSIIVFLRKKFKKKNNHLEFSLRELIWKWVYLCPQTRVTGLSRVLRHIGQSKKDSCILLKVFSLFFKFNPLLTDISKNNKLLDWIVLILISFLSFFDKLIEKHSFPYLHTQCWYLMQMTHSKSSKIVMNNLQFTYSFAATCEMIQIIPTSVFDIFGIVDSIDL